MFAANAVARTAGVGDVREDRVARAGVEEEAEHGQEDHSPAGGERA